KKARERHLRSTVIISLPSPTCFATISSPWVNAAFLTSYTSLEVLCIRSTIAFNLCKSFQGIKSTKNLRRWGGPSLTRKGRNCRMTAKRKSVFLCITVSNGKQTQRIDIRKPSYCHTVPIGSSVVKCLEGIA